MSQIQIFPQNIKLELFQLLQEVYCELLSYLDKLSWSYYNDGKFFFPITEFVYLKYLIV